MLSRKAEMQLVVGSMDRGRVAERLRAALAGLHELHVLRQKQGDMVQRALRTDTEHQEKFEQSDHIEGETNAEEKQRLEATLNALKHQLTRLRRQDIGLKTHLQQLDQQISELKLDGWKASAEYLESDSRPSSGFFELSDGGLGSLSNSCTSVYSECLSSSSQVSLLPQSSGPSAPLSRCTLLQADVPRRRSADESTAQPDIPRGLGVRLGSSGIRTGSISSERARQRPVSTGDLDRVINPGFGSYKPTEVKTFTLNRKLCDPTVDPKYQSNLVSRNGTEMYCYPSPLHAVALQSPIFSLSEDPTSPMASKFQEKQTSAGLPMDTLPKQEPTRPDGYIVKLLQRSSSKMSLHSDIGADKSHMSCKDNQGQGLNGFRNKQVNSGLVDVANIHGLLQQKTASFENLLQGENNLPKTQSDQEPMVLNSIRKEDPAQMCHGQYSASDRDHKQAAVMGVSRKVQKAEEKEQSIYVDQSNKGAPVISNQPERRPSFRYTNEESRSSDGDPTHTTQSEFVCAQFVPAGSQRVKVRQADKKPKSVKLRKRGNEKPPSKKHQRHSYRDGQEKGKGCRMLNRAERDSKIFKERERMDGHLVEPRLRSSSESSLLGPQNPCGTYHQIYRQPKQSSKSNKSHKAQFADQESPFPLQAKKKQSSEKWPYAADILPPAVPSHYQRSKDAAIHRIPQKPGMLRSVSMRPRSGHWGGLARPLPPSLSYSSYFSNLDIKYPPAPLSTRYPPKCESEYSAECASLFHSTIVESSEGELSDYTTNRFGDSESSQESQTASDSDSSLSLDEDDLLEEDEDEGGLVWAEAAVGPTAAGHHRPEPAACRIKASRALKKKIRRFQPASLKVMTLV
ncbi:dapper homolog 2 [Trichomycterus rosablanca]|uniref:dapper homolog 2 n=1 Tax=Trichomycterus rosablanca TaxID=2290929 RepID=UPI002F35C967